LLPSWDVFYLSMYRSLLTILLSVSLFPVYAQRATDTFKLYFDLGVPRLSASTEKKIDLLIYNDKIITGSTVMIIGYADYLGTEGFNKSLSMERAKNVKNYLVKYGINADDIKLCEGKGEVHRDVARQKDGFPTDRRVDIVVNNRTFRPAPPEKKKIPVKPKRDTARTVSITSFEEIKNMKPGSAFRLNNVYFPADRHVIKPESKETLEKLYTVLRDNPNLKISIEGHVCCIKDAPDALDIDTYEPTLSINRAKAIYNYLVGRGIEASRLKYIGFGRSRPVIPDEQTEQDAEKNRRVEIRVVENK
jgi:outer membrane protein OmpA-like peptidoglycan-associated protein